MSHILLVVMSPRPLCPISSPLCVSNALYMQPLLGPARPPWFFGSHVQIAMMKLFYPALESHIVVSIVVAWSRWLLICFDCVGSSVVGLFIGASFHLTLVQLALIFLGRFSSGGGERRRVRAHLLSFGCI